MLIAVSYLALSVCVTHGQGTSVLLDPGHGGDRPGAIANENCPLETENQINWMVADKAYFELAQSSGLQGFITRSGVNSGIDNTERWQMANNVGANKEDANGNLIPIGGVDYFLSIHANGSGNESAR